MTFDSLPTPIRAVSDLLRQHGISDWSTQAMLLGYSFVRYDRYNTPGMPRKFPSYIGVMLPQFPGSKALRGKNRRPGLSGMMVHLTEPDVAVTEVTLRRGGRHSSRGAI